MGTQSTLAPSDVSATTNTLRTTAVAILAAGMGKRMGNPNLAKVLAPLQSKPLLHYVLEQAECISAKIVVIVGHQRESVIEFATSVLPTVEFAVQEQQLGTGHALQQIVPLFANEPDCNIVILSGDVPLLKASTLDALLQHHCNVHAQATVLTTVVNTPTGYGRIIRDAANNVETIVEEKDATEEQKRITEINSGVYVFQSEYLFQALAELQNNNAQNEYYLTDTLHILRNQGFVVSALQTPNAYEVHGINTIADLETAAQHLTAQQ